MTEQTAEVAAAQDAPRTVDPAVEREAREMGWAPKESWRGRPEDFVEADVFVDRGRKIVPIIRAEAERAREEVRRVNAALERQTREFDDRFNRQRAEYDSRLQSQTSEFDRRAKALEAMNRHAVELARAQAVTDFENQKRQAAAAGDMEAYDRASAREQATFKDIAAREERLAAEQQRTIAEPPKAAQQEPAPPKQAVPEVPREVVEWAERNPWFLQDRSLKAEAEAIHVQLQEQSPYMPLAQNLQEVEETIKRRYPQKFGIRTAPQPTTQAPPTTTQTADSAPPRTPSKAYQSVEGAQNSSRTSGTGSKEKGWKELPDEAKAACDQMVSKGYLKGDGAKERYASMYWAEYADSE